MLGPSRLLARLSGSLQGTFVKYLLFTPSQNADQPTPQVRDGENFDDFRSLVNEIKDELYDLADKQVNPGETSEGDEDALIAALGRCAISLDDIPMEE